MTPAPPHDGARLAHVDLLRGLAALAVCWFHFTNGNARFLPDGWLRQSGAYGWAGVDVFFVISGFIIPFSMARRGYVVRTDAWRFIARRILRLDPPYFVTVLLMIVLARMSSLVPGFQGAPLDVSAAQVIAHVGYLNGFLGLPWLSPVFWSLAIEFQFYLVVALAFPLIAHDRARLWLASLALWALLALWPSSSLLVVHYGGLFACGFACFLLRSGRLGTGAFCAVLAVMAGATWWTFGPVAAGVAAATACVIAWGSSTAAIGTGLGQISYSLYLVHVPVGGRVVNLGTRFADTTVEQVAVLVLALAASVAAAVVMYWFVERPAQAWSTSVRYRHRRTGATGVAPMPSYGARWIPGTPA